MGGGGGRFEPGAAVAFGVSKGGAARRQSVSSGRAVYPRRRGFLWRARLVVLGTVGVRYFDLPPDDKYRVTLLFCQSLIVPKFHLKSGKVSSFVNFCLGPKVVTISDTYCSLISQYSYK